MIIYYYTRTGRSEIVAKTIAEKYEISIHEIRDDINWQGPLNYIKAGAYAGGKKRIPSIYEEDSDDDILLVFPLWAQGFPPAVRDFISKHHQKKIICVVTSLISKLKEREGFEQVIDLVGKELELDSVYQFIEKRLYNETD
ncbi:MAG: hypothetical protein R3Y57_00975 [Erysipelotrichaceae bacterium]